MAEAVRRACGVLSLTVALATASHAQTVVAGVVERGSNVAGPTAQSLFRLGATEVGQAPPGATGEAAARAFEAGKEAFLAFKTKSAERSLSEAVDLYLKRPDTLTDGGPAVRAVLLLAQVQLARRRTRPAEATLERALVELPGFPANESPAPDVAALIERVRASLKPRARPLRVRSTPPGLDVQVNGMGVGKTPVDFTVYAPIVVVTARAEGMPVGRRRAEMRRAGTQVDFAVGVASDAKPLLAAVRARDEAAAWAAASALAPDGEAVCVGLVDDDGVLVARLDVGRKAIAGAHAAGRPSDVEGWRALGRYCAANAPSNVKIRAARARLLAAPQVAPPPEPSSARSTWGWASTGVGAAAVGAGAYFGLQAADAADRFNEKGLSSDEDAARSNALGADIAFVVGGALIATGLYLLLSD